MARPYRSSVRAHAARETRARILTVAAGLVLEGGYGAMTVAGLAKAAGVSPQTVYNAVGGKAEVIKAAYDVLLAGDESPLAMRDRPEFRALQEAHDPSTYGAAYAAWTRRIYDRVGAFLAALLVHGTARDRELEDFVSTVDRERRTGNELSIPGELRAALGADLPRVIDIVWLLTAPETYERLVRRAAWSPDDYEQWLADELEHAVSTGPVA
jgi:AcrR family transcriptional regulator